MTDLSQVPVERPVCSCNDDSDVNVLMAFDLGVRLLTTFSSVFSKGTFPEVSKFRLNQASIIVRFSDQATIFRSSEADPT